MDIFDEIADDELIYDRFEVLATSEGFMPLDVDTGDYLHDDSGNNCFDNYWEAAALIDREIIKIRNK